MSIVSIKKKPKGKIEIDLTGPDGNAFVLIGKAIQYAKRLNREANANINIEEMKKVMMQSDYDNLINTFDEYFGEYITLYK
jgi:hypothetical protein